MRLVEGEHKFKKKIWPNLMSQLPTIYVFLKFSCFIQKFFVTDIGRLFSQRVEAAVPKKVF